MSALFGKPKIKIDQPPPVPTVDEARQNQEVIDRLRRRRGRAAASLTGPLGDTTQAPTSVKTLLGS